MKKLAALLLLALALGLYVWWFEIKLPREREVKEESAKSFLRFEESQAQRIVIEHEGKRLALEKKEGIWRLVEPVMDEADQDTAQRLVQALASAKIERTLEDKDSAEAKESYGLGKTALRLDLRFNAREATLFLGNNDYSRRLVYAALASDPKKIYLLDGAIKRAAETDMYRWRDKSFSKIKASEVERISWKMDDQEVFLQKKEGQWWFGKPSLGLADKAAVENLLYDTQFGKILQFAAERAFDPKSYGLDAPQMEIHLEGKGRKETLFIGGKQEDNFYLHNPARPLVAVVGKSWVEAWPKDPAQLRDKKLIHLSLSDLSEIEVQAGQEKFALVKKEEVWRLGGEKDVPPYKFWYRIDDARFTLLDAGEDEAFSRPDVLWRLKKVDGKTIEVAFVQKGEGYLAKESLYGRKGKVSKEAFLAALAKREDFLEKPKADLPVKEKSPSP